VLGRAGPGFALESVERVRVLLDFAKKECQRHLARSAMAMAEDANRAADVALWQARFMRPQ
jgi:hypothetical protein